ncbi:hypothetical protein XENTR_v10004318 [Xenopus tropicalis]|uniref:MYCBP-associated protein n=1 Tax=Xenopus tropicalis TaxID=8364 RepID=A0A7D9NK63_XENTR|nr:MYCBP-associated protein isoform X2 [Xenopus tropicalis]KAE8576780.1 hypothetical protein XENTR_v10004318 [Xenopus tropicalis]
MANRAGRRDTRTRTPTERKKSKGPEQPTPPVEEEPEPDSSNILKGDEIQALAIRLEDLEKIHPPRVSKEEQNIAGTNHVLVRKHNAEGRKRRLLVARPAPPELETRDLVYLGNEFSLSGSQNQIQPHSILGTLQDLKRVASARGNMQVAELIPEPIQMGFRKYEKMGLQQNKDDSVLPIKQDSSLINWQHHMSLRKQQVETLSRRLGKPADSLVMNLGEGFRSVQEEKQLIDLSISAAEHGKGRQLGSEFWKLPQRIGDELSGLTLTLPRSDRGYPVPITRIGKPHNVKEETGATLRSAYDRSWDKSLYLEQRRHELRAVMEELNFPKPDIDGLEVIGHGHPFTSVSAEQFPLSEEPEEAVSEEKENMDPLKDFPDVVPEFVLGPSLIFCGQLAQWVEDDVSHRDKVGISTRITFEALAGEKASSVLEVVNNGSAAIWYEWRRLPPPARLQRSRKEPRVQRFYFNTSSGVILPGETRIFPFHFKSPTAGIFGENWEFCTHPVLLAGALLEVSLWGIALHEDKTAPLREALQRELEAREALVVAQHIVEELLEGVRSPERPQSPVRSVTEEEAFSTVNPKLYYKHQTVQELKHLWDLHTTIPAHEESRSVSSSLIDSLKLLDGTEETHGPQANTDESSHCWNLSVKDLKQAAGCIAEDAEREMFLSQINKNIAELTVPPQDVGVDLLHQASLQLWREAVDEMVERSLQLRSLLGMPEKDVFVESSTLEPGLDQKPTKAGKEEKKGGSLKEEKKTSPVKDKEEKKAGKAGAKDKEDRPSSRKAKGKDEKKSLKSSLGSESNELISSGESLDPSPLGSQLWQVDPVLQRKYEENMYLEAYGILVRVIEDMVTAAEDLTPGDSTMDEEDFPESLLYRRRTDHLQK